jgi:hypothetical protein
MWSDSHRLSSFYKSGRSTKNYEKSLSSYQELKGLNIRVQKLSLQLYTQKSDEYNLNIEPERSRKELKSMRKYTQLSLFFEYNNNRIKRETESEFRGPYIDKFLLSLYQDGTIYFAPMVTPGNLPTK